MANQVLRGGVSLLGGSIGSGQLVNQLSTFASSLAEAPSGLPPQCTGNPGACGICE